jgi:subtilisin family serine protease
VEDTQCGGPSGFIADEVAAIEYSTANGAKVINASFGGPDFCNTELSAIASANAAGVLFVASSGNSGTNNDLAPEYPASYSLPNIISVSATDQNDRRASFANFGLQSVHVAAPGVYILSTITPGLTFSLCTGAPFPGYDICSGTSMAAPHVSGLAGLLLSYYTNFTYIQARSTILRYVDVLPDLTGWVETGGRINAYKALSSLLTPTNLQATGTTPSSISLSWTDNATGEDGYKVERKGADGTFVQIAVLGPNSTTFTDSGLTPSTGYTYRVRAYNTIPADSSYSNETSATTLSASADQGGGGGGGCSIGARQNMPTTMADAALILLPLVYVALMRRKR